ncbi:shikimate kinase [Flavobacterium sp.]|uniref:shikimate kinase n=1 Tax=Flavobacterium sp. TaxID=239 RepID=UPI00286DE576|nr:shikimate kinase [Flavobacterium sp.]
MKKIILVGYMGSGKSEIGKLLSKDCNLPFFDLDILIENALSKSISEIFDEKGEVYFRKIEHEIFQKTILLNQSFVLSLGGGTPCYAENHILLKDKSVTSIYLKASITTLQNRLKVNRASRPLLQNLSDQELTEFIAKHLFERSYYYNQSKETVVVDGKSPLEIVSEIEKLMHSL